MLNHRITFVKFGKNDTNTNLNAVSIMLQPTSFALIVFTSLNLAFSVL